MFSFICSVEEITVFRSLVSNFLCSAIVIFLIKEVWQFSVLK